MFCQNSVGKFKTVTMCINLNCVSHFLRFAYNDDMKDQEAEYYQTCFNYGGDAINEGLTSYTDTNSPYEDWVAFGQAATSIGGTGENSQFSDIHCYMKSEATTVAPETTTKDPNGKFVFRFKFWVKHLPKILSAKIEFLFVCL